MKFELFSRLYDEAIQYTDADMYVAERGWQDWMDEYASVSDVSAISDILFRIYDLAHMDIKELRNLASLSQVAFSSTYSVPRRTLQDWEYGANRTPAYMLKLISYTLFEKRCENEQN